MKLKSLILAMVLIVIFASSSLFCQEGWIEGYIIGELLNDSRSIENKDLPLIFPVVILVCLIAGAVFVCKLIKKED